MNIINPIKEINFSQPSGCNPEPPNIVPCDAPAGTRAQMLGSPALMLVLLLLADPDYLCPTRDKELGGRKDNAL
jgi:hypothetical protein